MTLAPLAAPRARALLAAAADAEVLVVGDLMIDRFIVGQVTRISPEAPVPIVRFRSEHVRLGGAANVAHNLAALGVRVSLVGVVGDDDAARRLRGVLAAVGIDPGRLVVDPTRPTVEKVRVVTERNQQVARIDYEQDDDVDATTESQLIDQIGETAGRAQVLLISDYLKGTVTRRVAAHLVAQSHAKCPLIVDPKIPHLGHYAGATIITPNLNEAEGATHLRIRSPDDARRAGLEFRAQAQCDAVLITLGEQGMWLSSPEGEALIPAVAREVADVTGAGDTVVATLAIALASGASIAEGAMLANYAAGVVVGKFGPATATVDEILDRFAEF